MTTKIISLALILMFSRSIKAQDVSALPIIASPVSDTSKPLIMYISGDGGANTFSKNLVKHLNDSKYPVVLLNSLKYFWSRRTPAQTATDVEKIIRRYRTDWKRQNVVIIGYSFGADVSPFVFNRLSKDIQASITSIALLSPSRTTDFEVHVSQMFGKSQSAGSDVANEINQIKQKPLIIMKGEDEEEEINFSKLLNKNYKLFTLKGGHRYDNNTAEVVEVIIKNL